MADKDQVDFYNNFTQHFKEQQNNARNTQFRQLVSKWVYKPQKVLDFGCALGYNSAPLTQVGCQVYGIDISPKSIEVAQSNYPKCTWYCGDILDGFVIEEKSFDFILMSDVIEHVPLEKHPQMFEILSSLTVTGGAIIASLPNSEIYDSIDESLHQPVEEKVEIPRLLQVMTDAGFSRIVSVYPFGKLYYHMIVQKP